MSRGVFASLDVARYGLLAAVLVYYLTAQPPLEPGRRWPAVALLAAIAVVAYALGHLRRTRPQAIAAYVAEVALIAAVGFVARSGPFVVLYFMAVAELFFLFRPRQGIWLAAALYGALGVNLFLIEGWREPLSFAANMLSILPAFFFIGATSHLAREQMRARERTQQILDELQAAHARLREYAAQVEELAVARERNRLAREIHDSIAHVLTGLLVQLQAARRLLGSEAARAEETLRRAEDSARRGLDDVRRSVRALRPEMGEGGVEALRRLGREFEEATGVAASLSVEGPARPLPPDLEVILYRAMQEGLTNAVRHGGATRVEARLAFEDGRVRLSVRDDGRGAGTISPGMGLRGLAERAEAAGGTFVCHTAPGEGFEAVTTLPVRRSPAPERAAARPE